jgi:hypothetical protein
VGRVTSALQWWADQFRQVGDAVPPLLAAHVIAACLGVQVESLEDAA